MDWFAKLPEGCISEILSHTSALDASRSSVVSKELNSVAQNDLVWDRFLPLDYQDIISKAVSPLKYATKKDLYFTLSHFPILIHQPKMSFSIDKTSGRKCFMVGARELMISWKGCWDFMPNPMSRFSEVAKLRSIGWIHIQGKIKTEILSKNTSYAAYLVFWLESKEGLRSSNTVIRLIQNDKSKSNGSKKERIESRETGKIGNMRGDGWLEIEMGRFYNGNGDDDGGEVEAWLTEINSPYDKSGFIVEGIEFRPL
ncbi:F-box protein At2g02240-like [Salvia miltiorrhiza]|uniref:F-box protein At2g02240-like n=1 Tax=Salvia miltiorrhiza TaxID=226208 RepID=UPI0025AD73AE|nr:F-box protein At2g02240-like [Salvia miltiorrhiza]